MLLCKVQQLEAESYPLRLYSCKQIDRRHHAQKYVTAKQRTGSKMLYTNSKEPSFLAFSNSFTKWSPIINALLIIFLLKIHNFLGWWNGTVGKSACCTNLTACVQSPDPMQKEKTGPQKLPSTSPHTLSFPHAHDYPHNKHSIFIKLLTKKL